MFGRRASGAQSETEAVDTQGTRDAKKATTRGGWFQRRRSSGNEIEVGEEEIVSQKEKEKEKGRQSQEALDRDDDDDMLEVTPSSGAESENHDINEMSKSEPQSNQTSINDSGDLANQMNVPNFFPPECNEINRYTLHEVIGKGSYGVVSSATDRNDGRKVAIKRINDVFENLSDATRILREIKLLRLLKHKDIVSVHSILLPPNELDFKDLYVVFELMETDLHQVIKANDDMTIEHHRYFLYQLLRGMKFIHTARVYHRDLKPKNILVNSDCKLKICDFGLARPMFDDSPTTVFWTDYVATRWYRAPELCGSFFTKYSPAVDIWSVGCIFAELMMRKPLFPGKNVVDQLQIITDLVGTPTEEEISAVRNEKAQRFLQNLPPKPKKNFREAFHGLDPEALDILELMLSFDPKKRPSPAQALEHPFLKPLRNTNKEPSREPVSKLDFGFEFKKMQIEEVRKLIYREVLEYHPEVLKERISRGDDLSTMNYVIPDAADRFRLQFSDMELNGGSRPRPSISMPPEKIQQLKEQSMKSIQDEEKEENHELETP